MNKTHKRPKTILLITCGIMLLAGGCMVGPNYRRPDVNTPASWAGQAGPKLAADQNAKLAKWWADFNDPEFVSLIDRAIKTNLDVKQAQERVLQARSQLVATSAPFWPTLNGTSKYTRSRDPGTNASNTFKVGLDAAWELDFFGGTRRNIEASEADLLAAVEDQRDALVTLVSEVATNYTQLRGFQQRILIAEENVKAQQHNQDIVRQRFEGGLVSALDVANADAQVASTLSQIPGLEMSARQTIYAISILLGQDPQSLLAELSPSSAIPIRPPEIPAGLPSELLRRRPDIRKAEAQIHSQTAKIGVATADLFPKFNLTGSIGYSGSNPGSLTQRNGFWSVGPSVDWLIFNMGGVQANIDVQKSLQRQTLLTYQQTILTAMQDVENALISYSKEKEHQKLLEDAVNADQKAVSLSVQLYTEGQTDFLNVIAAQGSLYGAQDSLVQSTQLLVTDLIALYKALGGGWDSNEPALTAMSK